MQDSTAVEVAGASVLAEAIKTSVLDRELAWKQYCAARNSAHSCLLRVPVGCALRLTWKPGWSREVQVITYWRTESGGAFHGANCWKYSNKKTGKPAGKATYEAVRENVERAARDEGHGKIEVLTLEEALNG